jgi:hypothetical protein
MQEDFVVGEEGGLGFFDLWGCWLSGFSGVGGVWGRL